MRTPEWVPANAASAEAVARLWARSTARRDGRPLPVGAPPELLAAVRERLSRPGAVVVVGRLDGELVACGVGTPREPVDDEAPTAEVSLVAVAPERWGAGLGRAVLRRLEEQLVRAGFAAGELQVLSANAGAVRLYQAAGWRLLGELAPHRDGPQVAYRKDRLAS